MRAVIRHIRFAWLEHQDARDGAVFAHAATSRLGFENALATLPRSGSATARVVGNLINTKILLKTFGKHRKRPFRGFLAIPGNADEFTLERWSTSPAIDGDKFVTDPSASHPIDLLIVSGHGSSGEIWGDASGQRSQIHLSNAFGRHIDEDRSGQLKCVIVPTCNNLHEAMAASWVSLFHHEKPVYVLLGYEGSYTGGPYGAQVMANFVDELATTPEIPLVEAWMNANESVTEPQPWAALTAKGAEGMSLQSWRDGTLPHLSKTHELLHFSAHHPDGQPAPREPDYEVRWVMKNGTVIDEENNHSSNVEVGLFDGQEGKIRIRATKPGATLKRGQKVYLLIYLYRGSREVALDELLTFSDHLLSPHPNTGHPVVAPEDGIAVFGDTITDAFRIIVPSDTDALQLSFKVRPSATNTFKATGPRGTHGRFILDFVYGYEFEQRADGSERFNLRSSEHRNVYAANTGALLRK